MKKVYILVVSCSETDQATLVQKSKVPRYLTLRYDTKIKRANTKVDEWKDFETKVFNFFRTLMLGRRLIVLL